MFIIVMGRNLVSNTKHRLSTVAAVTEQHYQLFEEVFLVN